ncbi:MAG TPA: hydroxymethylglutaryl-CoA reductase, degradative [Kofleriaceae bacterium]|nr:hydroxymethylglutaryl-CoA reductase, degradative [Kofleriaceae bacterium]
MSSRLPGFYRLSPAERRRRLVEASDLAPDDFAAVDPGALALDVADGMIENVVGTYALPFAVAVNFVVDGADVIIPMAVEEPSVVAAASNAARMARPAGFTSIVSAPVMIGQIQITNVDDVDAGATALRAQAAQLVGEARSLVPRLTDRGGGPLALDVRTLARSGPDGGVLVAHLHVDCRDAMGANLVNTLCEALADRVARIAGGKPGLRILSNLTDGRTVTVRCSIDDAQLAGDGAGGAEIRAAIAAASRFAELDPYRAATHNKGIMNGVDAVLVATGQDWRAVEAGAHAFACRDGAYRPLAVWRERAGGLDGELVMPLAVGTVGGALHVHPSARLALELAGVSQADRLASIAGAAGLATNLAALRALATEGIQRGHMALHARGLARAAGATGELVDRVAEELAATGEVKADRAREVLARLCTLAAPPFPGHKKTGGDIP